MSTVDSQTLTAEAPSPQAPLPRQEVTHKNIRRLEDAGYTFELDTGDQWQAEGTWWLISVPGAAPEHFIVRLAFDVTKGMITIYEAWNRHHDPIKTLKLRDMILSVWRYKANQDVALLQWIKYQGVVNHYTMRALADIYESLSGGSGDDLYIPASGKGRQMHQAYCRLMLHAVFATGARKMIREYPELRGRKIHGFMVSNVGRGNFPDLYINLGGTSDPTVEIEDRSSDSGHDDGDNDAKKPGDGRTEPGTPASFAAVREVPSSLIGERGWVVIASHEESDGTAAVRESVVLIKASTDRIVATAHVESEVL